MMNSKFMKKCRPNLIRSDLIGSGFDKISKHIGETTTVQYVPLVVQRKQFL